MKYRIYFKQHTSWVTNSTCVYVNKDASVCRNRKLTFIGIDSEIPINEYSRWRIQNALRLASDSNCLYAYAPTIIIKTKIKILKRKETKLTRNKTHFCLNIHIR